jgi:hypothetical protein
MKKIKGEHPRDPGTTITIKPYYPWEVTRARLKPFDTYPDVTHEYNDAAIRLRDAGGIVKGKVASLVIPRDIDPETEEPWWDCDGTRSREFIEMYVVETHMSEYTFSVEGFVHLGDWYGHDPEAFKFAYERWDQSLRKQD